MKISTVPKLAFIILLTTTSVGLCDLSDGLVAYYPFNGNANDLGIYASNGIVYGATLTSDRFGNGASAYYFDGDDYITASAANLPTEQRTVSLWFLADTLDTMPNLVGYGGGGYTTYGTSWLMGINMWDQSIMNVTCHWDTNTLKYWYTDPPVGTWYYYAITTDSSGTKLYVNGELKAFNNTFINNTIVSNTYLAMGVAVDTSGNVPYTDINVGYFHGIMDDVRIYDRALTENEIKELYNNSQIVPAPGAVLLGSMGISFAGWLLRKRRPI